MIIIYCCSTKFGCGDSWEGFQWPPKGTCTALDPFWKFSRAGDCEGGEVVTVSAKRGCATYTAPSCTVQCKTIWATIWVCGHFESSKYRCVILTLRPLYYETPSWITLRTCPTILDWRTLVTLKRTQFLGTPGTHIEEVRDSGCRCNC